MKFVYGHVAMANSELRSIFNFSDLSFLKYHGLVPLPPPPFLRVLGFPPPRAPSSGDRRLDEQIFLDLHILHRTPHRKRSPKHAGVVPFPYFQAPKANSAKRPAVEENGAEAVLSFLLLTAIEGDEAGGG